MVPLSAPFTRVYDYTILIPKIVLNVRTLRRLGFPCYSISLQTICKKTPKLPSRLSLTHRLELTHKGPLQLLLEPCARQPIPRHRHRLGFYDCGTRRYLFLFLPPGASRHEFVFWDGTKTDDYMARRKARCEALFPKRIQNSAAGVHEYLRYGLRSPVQTGVKCGQLSLFGYLVKGIRDIN